MHACAVPKSGWRVGEWAMGVMGSVRRAVGARRRVAKSGGNVVDTAGRRALL